MIRFILATLLSFLGQLLLLVQFFATCGLHSTPDGSDALLGPALDGRETLLRPALDGSEALLITADIDSLILLSAVETRLLRVVRSGWPFLPALQPMLDVATLKALCLCSRQARTEAMLAAAEVVSSLQFETSSETPLSQLLLAEREPTYAVSYGKLSAIMNAYEQVSVVRWRWISNLVVAWCLAEFFTFLRPLPAQCAHFLDTHVCSTCSMCVPLS